MKRHNPIQTREAWVLCFLLGVIMLNYPFLEIFNKGSNLFGIPILYLYFLIGWPVSIAVTFFFSRSLGHGHEDGGSDEEQGGGKESR